MNSIVLVGLVVTVIHFLQAGRKHATLPGAEESMTTTIEFAQFLAVWRLFKKFSPFNGKGFSRQ
jgi:hypothetical protein